jgi:hypothetical protein
MDGRTVKPLALRAVVPTLGATIYFLVAKYVFEFEKAKSYAIAIALASIIVLVVEYIWRDWRGNRWR